MAEPTKKPSYKPGGLFIATAFANQDATRSIEVQGDKVIFELPSKNDDEEKTNNDGKSLFIEFPISAMYVLDSRVLPED